MVAVFLTSTLIGMRPKYPPPTIDATPFLIVSVLTLSIMSGFCGILWQSFRRRLTGWTLVFMLLQVDLLELFHLVLLEPLGVTAPLWIGLIVIWSMMVLSLVLTYYPVVDAYHHRLSEVSCQDDELAAIRSARSKYTIKVIIIITVLFILLSILFLYQSRAIAP